MLTHERINQLLTVNPETGKIYWKRRKRVKPGSEAGCVKKGLSSDGGGYRIVGVDQVIYRAHHIIWAFVTGEWPTSEIDHINGNRDDNRFCNLREASIVENRLNRRIQSNNKSGFKWVYWCKRHQTWRAEIRESSANGRKGRRHLFYASGDDPAALHAQACEAAQRLHGAFYNPG